MNRPSTEIEYPPVHRPYKDLSLEALKDKLAEWDGKLKKAIGERNKSLIGIYLNRVYEIEFEIATRASRGDA